MAPFKESQEIEIGSLGPDPEDDGGRAGLGLGRGRVRVQAGV